MNSITTQGRSAPLQFSCRQAFYISLPILHGLSAIAALVICFQCHVGPMAHQALVPRAQWVPGLFNSSRVKMFLAAYHWAEDAEFDTHKWNPFALAMVFQWLTAGFALRTVAPMAQDGVVALVWYGWLIAGYTVFLVWSLVEAHAMCVAMFATVTVSFMASAAICLLALGPPRFHFGTQDTNYAVLNPPPESGDKPPLHGESQLAYANGRQWYAPRSLPPPLLTKLTNVNFLRRVIPRRIKGLKQPSTHTQGETQVAGGGGAVSEQIEYEQIWGVFFRYAEYCVTAPLLFLAVVCLLVVDAPAW